MSAESVPMIYSAICGVMKEIGAVGKDDTNRQQGFKYRSIDAVMNALKPAMTKNNIFCVPEVLEQSREERATAKGGMLIYSICRIRYTFYATDGSSVQAIVVGEGMDSGDKATNKAMAAAFKYAFFQTFCIPTENLMDDPDAETPDSSKKNAPAEDRKRGHPAKKAGDDMYDTDMPDIDIEKNSLLDELGAELARTGYGWRAVVKTYKVDAPASLSKLQIKDCIAKMRKLPDKVAQ